VNAENDDRETPAESARDEGRRDIADWLDSVGK